MTFEENITPAPTCSWCGRPAVWKAIGDLREHVVMRPARGRLAEIVDHVAEPLFACARHNNLPFPARPLPGNITDYVFDLFHRYVPGFTTDMPEIPIPRDDGRRHEIEWEVIYSPLYVRLPPPPFAVDVFSASLAAWLQRGF